MKKLSPCNNVRLEQNTNINICTFKLGVLLLVSRIEYFDHSLAKNYTGNGFEKSLFLVYPSLKEQIFTFIFLFERNIIAQAQFFIAEEETVLIRK